MTKRRLFTIAVTAWVVLLAGFALFWPLGEPTVREQATVADAVPYAAEATAAAAGTLAGFDDVAYAVTPFEKAKDCQVNLARSGVVYQQVVRVYTRPENAASVAERLTGALRDRFGLKESIRDAYSGTAGGFVDVRLVRGDAGLITWTADAGCRPDDEPFAAFQRPGSPSETAAAIAERFGAAMTWTRADLGCGGSTVAGTAQVPGLAEAMPEVAAEATFASGDPVLWFAVTDAGSSVVAAAEGDTLTVSATTDCP